MEDNATRRAVIDAFLYPRWPDLPGRDVKYGNEISPMITGLRAIQPQAAKPIPYMELQRQLPQHANGAINRIIRDEENSSQSIDEAFAAQQAREVAARKQRHAVLPPGGRQEHPMGVAGRLGEIGGGVVDFMLPTGPLDVGLMVAGGPFGKVGTKVAAATLGAILESDEAQAGPISRVVRAARRRAAGYSNERFWRGESSGNLPDECRGGGYFSRNKEYADDVAKEGGQPASREFALNLERAFSVHRPLTAEAYSRLVRAASDEPALASALVDMVAPGKDAAWLSGFASRNPQALVTDPSGTFAVRSLIWGSSKNPETVLIRAGYDAIDSGVRDVRKLTGQGIRLAEAEFDPAKTSWHNIMASMLAGGWGAAGPIQGWNRE